MQKTPQSFSSNDKVIHYLQYSTNNPLKMLEKTSTNNFFSFQQHRQRSSSGYDSLSSSSSSIIDSPFQSDGSIESSLSDSITHCSPISSNRSSDEDLDFNIGFEQVNHDDNNNNNNNNDDDDDDEQYISNKNNADVITLLGESIVDDYFRQSSNSTVFNDDYELTNDDTITEYCTKQLQEQQQRRRSFLHDSTHTLCSHDRFSAYTENDQETEQTTGLAIRSNSFSIFPMDNKTKFIETAPKKVVRFADMMGLDLETIRYMTPPDQTLTTIIQECARLQRQRRFSTNQIDIPNNYQRTKLLSSSSSSLTKQYNLVSKNFTSPINIIPLIYGKQILLECLYTQDSTVYGTIRVHNCAYHKHVFIRLTHDEWQTSIDIQASHSMNYSHDNTDTYTFQIVLPKNQELKRILFAVCLQAMSQEFWDNNNGWNYVLDIFERRL